MISLLIRYTINLFCKKNERIIIRFINILFEKRYTVLNLFRNQMMLICSPAYFLINICSLEHSLSIKNDFGWAANQNYRNILRKLNPMILIIEFGSVQNLLLKNS